MAGRGSIKRITGALIGFHEVGSGTLCKTKRPARRSLSAGAGLDLLLNPSRLKEPGVWLGGLSFMDWRKFAARP